MFVAKLLLFLLAGFIWEALITSYHRSVIAEKNGTASFLAVCITLLSLLVISHITKEIIICKSLWVYLLVVVFAAGKGIGAYTSLSWWSKRIHKAHNKNDWSKKRSSRR